VQSIRNFSEANAALAQFVPQAGSLGRNYTLDRMRRLMDALGNPQDKYKVVHVAGTSGKTSTSYFMAALLSGAGQKVGLTVSPHIDEVNERVQINLIPLEETVFCRELNEFLSLLRNTGLSPTYFELLVAFAYWEFARQEVDYAVVEVGLGGLLDGTNVIHQTDKLCIITDIGLDHTNVLGNDLASIAGQKAGIIMPHTEVFTYQQADEVMQVFRKVSDEQSAHLTVVRPSKLDATSVLPAFQQRNCFLASRAYIFLVERDGLAPLPTVLAATEAVNIPGRMDVMSYQSKTLVFDGAHNEQKMHVLTGAMKAAFGHAGVAVLVGMVEDKQDQLLAVAQEISTFATAVLTSGFSARQDIPRQPLSPERISDAFIKTGFTNVTSYSKLDEALQALLNRPEPVLLITGSFYLVSSVRQLLREGAHASPHSRS
jgi:dihydrofolate synthase/folylpolyglutamate synthase